MRAASRRPLRWLLPPVVALAAVVCLASPAAAHASFVSASPGPGVGVPEAPDAVAMRFSEPLNVKLSHIDVLDRSGHEVGVGVTEAVPRDPLAMRRRLGFLPPGQYTVRWVTVSTVDGHSLAGTYYFAVGVSADPGQHTQSGPLTSGGLVGLAGRWLAVIGLTLWAGVTLLAARARMADVAQGRIAMIGRLAPVAALVGTAVSLLSVAVVATGGPAALAHTLTTGPSAHWRAVELAASGLGVAVGTRRHLQLPVVAAALLAEASSGHAASSTSPTIAALSLVAHLAAVGVWLFAILAVLAAPDTRRALKAMAWPAVAAAVVVAATGTLNTVLELNSASELISTGYGLTIVAKIDLLAGMAILGVLNRRRRHQTGIPQLLLRRPVTGELLAGTLALAAAAVLVAFPNPPRQADAAERADAGNLLPAQAINGAALSLATASGPFVVGLTVTPPQPGPVAVQVLVLGAQPGDGLGNAHLDLTGPTNTEAPTNLSPCGFGCFDGHGNIPAGGNWTFVVTLDSTRGAIHATYDAPVPAPDGRALLLQVLADEEKLRSAKLTETLSGAVAGPVIQADYRFSTDAFEIRVGGRDQIVIGSQSYDKATAASPWRASDWPGPPVTWPRAYFRTFWGAPAAVRILGHQPIDGADMVVIAFARPDLPAWLRLWVGDDGLVHREEMRAEGHLMDHVYTDFNIGAPLKAPIP